MKEHEHIWKLVFTGKVNDKTLGHYYCQYKEGDEQCKEEKIVEENPPEIPQKLGRDYGI
jgi:hypothetical protein